ncbi:MAG: glycosyltransferase family 2 protein [Candidatus Omnitrophica bacterium]|nr:glycosyltransferase family 2 protein [Candidatus Omnitrophota bacterium]
MDSLKALVSVVIPAYNRADKIEASIRSVQAQTYPHWEIIVSDDGSKDNTVDVVRKLMKEDNRIRIVTREKNAGAQSARNSGVREAAGEWIAFLDSDDQWLTDSLERRMRIAHQKNVQVVHSNAYILHPGKEMELYKVPALSGQVYKQVLRGEGPMFPCLLIKKSALEAIGLLDEAIISYQEWDTAIRLAKRFEFGFEPQPTFIYDYRTQNAISRDSNRAGRGYEQIVKKHLGEIITHAGLEVWSYHMWIASQWYQKGNSKGDYWRCRLLSLSGKCLNPKYVAKTILNGLRKVVKAS